jgi:hypothetical protein
MRRKDRIEGLKKRLREIVEKRDVWEDVNCG